MSKGVVVISLVIITLAGLFLLRNSGKTTPLPNVALPSSTPVTSTPNDSPKFEVIAKNLQVPWGLVFLPDKSILVTERSGRVRLINKEGKLEDESVADITVKQVGEGGLLGITIHPDFTKNHYVYLYYTYSENGQMYNKVVRFEYQPPKFIENKIIADRIPSSSNHNGGRIKFGPDGYLYISTGDAENPSQAQNTNTLGGKILRVTSDGKAAPGNPFNTLIYSYGHRNVQGLAWDNQGRLWATEHGRSGALSGLDELNLIEAGKNYGWPIIQGDETKPGMTTPKINSGPNYTWAPSGAAFFESSIFFGGLRGQTLYEAKAGTLELKKHFEGQFGRVRDVILGPDNLLYITTSNQDGRGTPSGEDDRITRINPKKL